MENNSFLEIDYEIINIPQLTLAEKMILGYIDGWNNKHTQSTYASYQTISTKLRIVKSTTIKSINKLIGLGLVTKIKTGKRSKRLQSNPGKIKELSELNKTIPAEDEEIIPSDSPKIGQHCLKIGQPDSPKIGQCCPKNGLYKINNNNNNYKNIDETNNYLSRTSSYPEGYSLSGLLWYDKKQNKWRILESIKEKIKLLVDGSLESCKNGLPVFEGLLPNDKLENIYQSITNRDLDGSFQYQSVEHYYNCLFFEIEKCLNKQLVENVPH